MARQVEDIDEIEDGELYQYEEYDLVWRAEWDDEFLEAFPILRTHYVDADEDSVFQSRVVSPHDLKQRVENGEIYTVDQ